MESIDSAAESGLLNLAWNAWQLDTKNFAKRRSRPGDGKMKKKSAIVCLLLFLVYLIFVCRQLLFGQSPNEESPISADGFGRNNGFLDDKTFADAKSQFEEEQVPETGLGPVFNNVSCVSCHRNPVTGGNGAFTELRSGRFDGGRFVPSLGGSLIHTNALSPDIQERVLAGNDLRGFRVVPSIFGLGFVECISNDVFKAVSESQPEGMRGEIVPVELF